MIDNRIWKQASDNAPIIGAIVRWKLYNDYRTVFCIGTYATLANETIYTIRSPKEQYDIGFIQVGSNRLEYLAYETIAKKEWRIQALADGKYTFNHIWLVAHMATPLRCGGLSYIDGQPMYRVGSYAIPADVYSKGWQYIEQYKETHEPYPWPVRKKRWNDLND